MRRYILSMSVGRIIVSRMHWGNDWQAPCAFRSDPVNSAP